MTTVEFLVIMLTIYLLCRLLNPKKRKNNSVNKNKENSFIEADYEIIYHDDTKKRQKKQDIPKNLGANNKLLKKNDNKDYAFVVFDLETTGINTKYHKIIEIGAIKVNKSSDEHQTFQVLLKQKRKLPKKIVEMTGITDELLEKEGISEEVAIKEFLEFIGDLPLVAYNSSFDMRFLKKSAEKYGYSVENEVQCALTLARKKVKDVENYKLSTIAKYFGINSDGAHRALDDCKITLQVFDALNV